MIEPSALRDIAALQRVHPLWLERRDFWRDVSEIQSRVIDLDRHLVRGHLEPTEEYSVRKKMTRFVPETPVALGQVCGAVCSDQPDRSELPGPLADWTLSVDARGRTLGAWMERVATPTTLLYGACHVLLDPPPAPEGVEIHTMADLQAAGLDRVRLVHYTPLPLRNWGWDQASESLDWVLIYEEGFRLEGPLGRRVPQRIYRIWDRDAWHEVRTEPKDASRGFRPTIWDVHGEAKTSDEEVVVEVRSGPHGLAAEGKVPIVSMIVDPLEEIVGASFVRSAVELDFKRLLLESDHSYSLHMDGHQQLVVKSRETPETVGVGTGKYIHLDPGGPEQPSEDAYYLQHSPAGFEARERAIRQAHVDSRRQIGADPRAIYDGERSPQGQAESGVSRIVSYRTSEGRHVGSIRDAMEHAENELYHAVAPFFGTALPDGVLVTWPRQSSDDPLTDTITSMGDARSLVRSPTFKREAEKRIVDAALGDDIDPTLRATIVQEIDSMEEPQPLALTLGGMGPESDSPPDAEDVDS